MPRYPTKTASHLLPTGSREGEWGGGIPLEPLAPKMLGRDCLCENRIDNTR